LKTIHFEYLGEDIEVPGAIKWNVEAIHVTTTRNNRKFTLSELREAGRSLSYRPLDINHDPERTLPFPENKTLHMNFNETKMVVEGVVSISHQPTNAMIESGKINAVSIEQIPSKETCNEVLCEQHGVAFIGLGLLERGVLPGDKMAGFTGKTESVNYEPLQTMMVSDEQRMCTECTDNVACHSCYHKKKAFESAQDKLNKEIDNIMKSAETQEKTKEAIIAQAISKIEGVTLDPKTSWALFRTGSATYDSY
jgi:hypothetical protein